MTDFLKSVDTWFLILCIILLGGWFVFSVKRIFVEFGGAVLDLRSLIRELFEKHYDLENRMSSLEGRCDAMHGPLQPGGRRTYDPPIKMT